MIELRDITMQVGSRVKTLRRYPNNYDHSPDVGALGTVMRISNDKYALVKFDEWFEGHEVNRVYHDKFGDGYYWSCKLEDLEL